MYTYYNKWWINILRASWYCTLYFWTQCAESCTCLGFATSCGKMRGQSFQQIVFFCWRDFNYVDCYKRKLKYCSKCFDCSNLLCFKENLYSWTVSFMKFYCHRARKTICDLICRDVFRDRPIVAFISNKKDIWRWYRIYFFSLLRYCVFSNEIHTLV